MKKSANHFSFAVMSVETRASVESKLVTIRMPQVARTASVLSTKRTIHRVVSFSSAAVLWQRGFVDKVVN